MFRGEFFDERPDHVTKNEVTPRCFAAKDFSRMDASHDIASTLPEKGK
jgi:hypothetical protein